MEGLEPGNYLTAPSESSSNFGFIPFARSRLFYLGCNHQACRSFEFAAAQPPPSALLYQWRLHGGVRKQFHVGQGRQAAFSDLFLCILTTTSTSNGNLMASGRMQRSAPDNTPNLEACPNPSSWMVAFFLNTHNSHAQSCCLHLSCALACIRLFLEMCQKQPQSINMVTSISRPRQNDFPRLFQFHELTIPAPTVPPEVQLCQAHPQLVNKASTKTGSVSCSQTPNCFLTTQCHLHDGNHADFMILFIS